LPPPELTVHTTGDPITGSPFASLSVTLSWVFNVSVVNPVWLFPAVIARVFGTTGAKFETVLSLPHAFNPPSTKIIPAAAADRLILI
jgi:hypothetical protein